MTLNNYIFYFVILTLSSGCGLYSFSGSSIPKSAQTVYIKETQNNTLLSNPELAQLITESLNNYILIIDLLNLNFRKAKIKKRKNCLCN